MKELKYDKALDRMRESDLVHQTDIVGSPVTVNNKLRWKLDSIDTSLVFYGEYKGTQKIKIVGESADQQETGSLVIKLTINGVEQPAQSFDIVAGINELEINIPAYAGYAELGLNYDATSTLAASFLIYPSTEVIQ